jgi:hypothetical protein
MHMFSDPTVARLANLVSAAPLPREQRLRLILREVDLARFTPPVLEEPITRLDMVLLPVDAANRAAGQGDSKASRALLAFVDAFVNELQPPLAHQLSDQIDALAESLRADGFELRPPETRNGAFTVLPTELSAAPLAPTISALEDELARRGYTVTLNHLQQAVDNLLTQNFEAANASVRAALEDLVTRLAIRDGYAPRTGAGGRQAAGQGGPAISHLVETPGTVPPNEGGLLLRGLWLMSHTNGSHPGTSSAEEARRRLQLFTATAGLVLTFFPG